jgi:hypothetical protein
MAASRYPPGNGGAPLPYRLGWRAPWRGDWGDFSDGHSRLSYLARKIEREELVGYLGDTPERKRTKTQAARYLALVEMTSKMLGTERNTPRKLTALQAAADRQLVKLERIGAKIPTGPVDLARALSQPLEPPR